MATTLTHVPSPREALRGTLGDPTAAGVLSRASLDGSQDQRVQLPQVDTSTEGRGLMQGEFGMSTSDASYPPQGLQRTSRSVQRRRFGRLLGIAALAGFGLLAGLATSAQAATDSLYAAPSAACTGDCSSPTNACAIADAVTSANAMPVADTVRIALASGTYPLSSPTPTALSITFAGPNLTIAAG